MAEALALDPSRTSVLVLDFQAAAVAMVSKEPGPLLERAARLLGAARRAKLPVIYVVVEFRPGHPEIHPRNLGLVMGIKRNNLFVRGEAGTLVHPAVAPAAGEVVIAKRRISAFSSSDLELVLRANGTNTLLLLGLSTSGVILSTVRHAFDADYTTVIAEDCCADPDPELHRTLIDKVLKRQARISTADDIVAALDTIP